MTTFKSMKCDFCGRWERRRRSLQVFPISWSLAIDEHGNAIKERAEACLDCSQRLREHIRKWRAETPQYITSMEDLVEAANSRMAVYAPRGMTFNNPTPAAFILSMPARSAQALIDRGLCLYVKREDR